jgi:ATP-dependent exoDNAse (exonuclease V) beta subunit
VHRTIEALGRGRRGESLREFIRAVVLDEEPLGDDHAVQLERVADSMLASDTWRVLTATGTAVFELPVARASEREGFLQMQEGVVDAAVLGPSGWRVIDWKTGDAGVTAAPDYLEQVTTYADILAALSGSAAEGRIERIVTPPR